MELVYFNMAGRAEAIRIALHIAKVDFKDTRLSFPEYKEAKSKGEYATGVPLLKLASGQSFTQSLAILRYAGKLGSTNLYPSDPVAALAVDEILDVTQDMLTKCPQHSDAETKKKLREEYAAGKLKGFFAILKDRYQRNGGPFICGTSLTVADLAVKFGIVDAIKSGSWDYIDASYVDQFAEVTSAAERVSKHPGVEAYINSRS